MRLEGLDRQGEIPNDHGAGARRRVQPSDDQEACVQTHAHQQRFLTGLAIHLPALRQPLEHP